MSVNLDDELQSRKPNNSVGLVVVTVCKPFDKSLSVRKTTGMYRNKRERASQTSGGSGRHSSINNVGRTPMKPVVYGTDDAVCLIYSNCLSQCWLYNTVSSTHSGSSSRLGAFRRRQAATEEGRPPPAHSQDRHRRLSPLDADTGCEPAATPRHMTSTSSPLILFLLPNR